MYMKFLNRLRQLQELIENGNTGSPRKLSKKLYISESQLYVCLRTMKKLGVPVNFAEKRTAIIIPTPVV